MKTWESKVYVKTGNAKIAHTAHVQADNAFAAKQQFGAQFGHANVITTPREVTGSAGFNSAPWMENF